MTPPGRGAKFLSGPEGRSVIAERWRETMEDIFQVVPHSLKRYIDHYYQATERGYNLGAIFGLGA